MDCVGAVRDPKMGPYPPLADTAETQLIPASRGGRSKC